MNTKGFTLVELLAVVIILALLALLTSTAVTKLVSDAKNDLSNTQIKLIKEATEVWMADNLTQLPENNQCSYLTLEDLKKHGLLDSEILDPKNNQEISNDIKIKISTTKSEYGKLIRNIEVNPTNSDGCNYFAMNNEGTQPPNDNTEEEPDTGGNENTGDGSDNDIEPPVNLAQYITDLYNNSTTKTDSLEVDGITYSLDTTNNLLDDRLGGTVSSGGNIRYYGANPNNYIDIGDRDSNGNVILWRIIGVFETKYATTDKPCNTDSDGDLHYDNCATNKLVKIIRANPLEETENSTNLWYWDYKQDKTYKNNWDKATLKTILNEAYYNSTTTSYYTRSGSTKNADFTSTGLSEKAQSKVENVLWNLGGSSSGNGNYTNDWYAIERGTTVYVTLNNERVNPTEWVGKIGLMYVSDLGYAADLGKCNYSMLSYNTTLCKGTDWLYNSAIEWAINTTGYTDDDAHTLFNKTGYPIEYTQTYYTYKVRPVLYLKSDVSIVGTGTSEGINYYVVMR